MYKSLSDKSRKSLFKGYRSFSSWRAIQIGKSKIYVDGLDIDYKNKISLVAVITIKGKKKIIGDARYYLDKNGRAEISLAVSDKYQNKGLGQLLLQKLIKLMKKRKIKSAYAIIDEGEEKIKHILKKFGFKATEKVSGEILMELKL